MTEQVKCCVLTMHIYIQIYIKSDAGMALKPTFGKGYWIYCIRDDYVIGKRAHTYRQYKKPTPVAPRSQPAPRREAL